MGDNKSYPKTRKRLVIIGNIVVASMLVGAVFGLVWNGIEMSRTAFSLHRAFLGVICGVIMGVFTSGYMVFVSGCGWLIAAVIFWPLTFAIAGITILYFTVKGFIVYARGGAWDDL